MHADEALSSGNGFGVEFGLGATVLDGDDLDELATGLLPVVEEVGGAVAEGVAPMTLDQGVQGTDVLFGLDMFQQGQAVVEVAALVKVAVRVPDVDLLNLNYFNKNVQRLYTWDHLA